MAWVDAVKTWHEHGTSAAMINRDLSLHII